MSLMDDTPWLRTAEVMTCQRHPHEDRTAVIDATWAAVVAIDADCRIRLFNREAERITGLPGAAVLGRRVCEVLWTARSGETRLACNGTHPACNGTHPACPWQRAVTGTERRRQPREATMTVGEQRIEVLLGARPTRLSDDSQGAVLTFVDLTYRRALEHMRAALMADVFHELRAPICAISIAAHFLSADLEHLPTESLRSLVATMQHNASALLADLDDLLNRSTFTTDAPAIAPRAMDLRPVVDQVVWKLQPLLDKRGQRVRTAYGVLPLLWADERRVEQVLVNLLVNANKYSVEGDEIIIAAVTQGDWVRVSVEDHGPGIPPEECARVFERFYRGNASASTVGGAGLGLCIVHCIVAAHGGAVGVEQSSPHGARFWFTLPVAGHLPQ